MKSHRRLAGFVCVGGGAQNYEPHISKVRKKIRVSLNLDFKIIFGIKNVLNDFLNSHFLISFFNLN